MAASPQDVNGLLLAFFLQLAIAAALFTAFSVIRPTYRTVYEPKFKYAPDAKRPKPLGSTPLAWITPTIFSNECDYIGKIGLDSIMFLRFLNFLVKLYGGILLVAIPLIFFNFYAPSITGMDGIVKQSDVKRLTATTQLSVLTMQNLNPESKWFYLYTALAWVVSLYSYMLLYNVWREYVALRQEYFTYPEFLEAYHNRTLMITRIPDELKSETAIYRFVDSLETPAPIEQLVMGRDFEVLSNLVKKHGQINAKMEKAVAKYFETGKRPSHMEKTKSLQSVDSISAYGTDLRDLEEKIYHMRSIMDEKYLPKSHAFVSFPTIRDAQRAIHLISNKMHFYNKTGRLLYPKVKPCPNFEDLHWDNLGLERNQLLMRRLISYGIFFLLTIGWTAVTGFVASLTNISKIAQVNASIAASIQKTPYGVVVLESIVAPLLLVCLNLLLPLVLRVAAKFQGVTSSNGVERSVLVKFFIFQVYQAAAYIGLNALGAKFIQDAKASGDPASSLSSTTALVEALMQGFINSSTFYMTFIVIGYTAYGIEIIQGVSLLMNLFQRTFFKMTPRQQYTLNQPPSFSYMATYGSLFIAFMVSLAYCLVAPLITPLAASLFGIAYLALKYQMFYVYTTKIENGGNWWPRIFDVTCVVIALFQLMTFGAIVFTAANRSSTGNGKLASLLVAVLMAVTLVVWYTMRRYFNYRANDIQVPVSPRRRGELDCHIYDPCMGKPLDKVWVSKENVVLLSKIYQPIYDNTKEYMIKEHLVGPETLSHQRRMGKRLAYFGLQKEIEWESECMDDAIDRPPELVKAMGLLRSRFGSQSLRQSISVTTLTDKDLMLTEEDFHAS